jgi:DNA repair protein RecO (recombination protein O)
MNLIEDKAFILFSRPQGETSLWLSVLTEHHGRFSLLYKGGQKKAAMCAPFAPVILTWKSTRQGLWLSGCERMGFSPRLTGMANWSGLYANELLHKGMHDATDMSAMFWGYQRLLQTLGQETVSVPTISLALRRFEWQFLQVLGYGFPLQDVTGTSIQAQYYYRWHDDAWHLAQEGILGAQLLTLVDDGDVSVGMALRQLLQWRLCQLLPASAMVMRQWWEQLG